MSIWQTVMTTMVRHLVNDAGDSQTFTDDRIQEAIVVSGLMVAQEYKFSTNYTFDIDTPDISPDPVDSDTYDSIAIALFTLKAACLLSMNQYQAAVNSGIRVRDGDSEVDTTAGFKGYADIVKVGPCGSYEKLLRHRSFLDSMRRGKAIMSPLTHSSFMLRGSSALIEFYNDFRVER